MSIAELQRAGVVLRPAEAVAIAQELIRGCRNGGGAPSQPALPPTPGSVTLASDGSVACSGGDAACSVPDIGTFLQTLLPPGVPGVAGGLRYTVARALLEVDAPPFETIAELSRALERHERGERADVIRGLLQRVDPPVVDRRRSDPAVAILRRQLRESDARAYDQQLALDALTGMVPSTPAPPRRRALTIGLVAAAALAAAASMALTPGRRPAPAAVEARTEAVQAAPVADRAHPVPGTLAARPAAGGAAATSYSAAPKRERRTPAPSRERRLERRSRFDWLHSKIAIRVDPL